MTVGKISQKITLIGPVFPYRGGIAHFTTMLAKQLVDVGHEVQVISFKQQYPAWLYPGESDKDHSPARLKVPADYILSPLNPISWRKTFKAIRTFQPDQVIFSWWVTFWGPAFSHIIARLKRWEIPVSMLIHNTMPHEARFFDRFLARQALKGADRYIVMTEKEKIRLQNLLPEADNIKIAPLPIYHAFKDQKKAQAEVRKSLRLPEGQPVILFFGFIRPYKGLSVLIDALGGLIESGTQAHLLTVGEFWDEKTKYLSQIAKLGLKECVHINDKYIPDDAISEFFKAADVFAAPYIDGTQSAALKTALGFGLPAVATEIIKDGFLKTIPDRCKFVPNGDPQALAEALKLQFKKPVQTKEEIQDLVARSWSGMLAVVSEKLVQLPPPEEQNA